MLAVSLGLAVLLVSRGCPSVGRQIEAYPYYNDGLKGTKGFGQVKPRTIFYGGDPTGLVCYIHWRNWGAPTALGSTLAGT